MNRNLQTTDSNFNTLFCRPLTGAENFETEQALFFNNAEIKHKTLLGRKFFDENLIIFRDDKFNVIIDPLLNFSFYTNKNNNGYRNTRGAIIRGNLSSKIFFYSAFEESQAAYPFIDSALFNTYGIIPGVGRVKPLRNFNEFDFGNSFAAVSLKVSQKFNFTLGYDKLFIGDGYRSMILSDFSAPLFFYRTLLNFDIIQWGNIFTKVLNPNFNNILNLSDYGGLNIRYPHKFISYNFVKFKLLKKLQLTLIQATIISDKINVYKAFVYNYSPIVSLFYCSLDTIEINNLGGLNLSWKDLKFGIIYSQIVLDIQNSTAEYAYQVGYKNNNFIIRNVFLLLEYNFVSPNMYVNTQNRKLHYGHYNMPLAHPSGNNISELVFISSYTYRDLEFLAKLNFNLKSQNYNIFNNEIILPKNQSKAYYDFQVIYNINNSNLSQFFIGVIFNNRSFSTPGLTWFNIGFRNALRGNYYDF